MKFNREKFLDFSGWLLITLAILNLYFKIYYGFGGEILWLCNNAPIVIGLGIILRNQKIVLGVFSLLFVASLGWNIEAIHFLATGKTIFAEGVSFDGRNLVLQIGTIANHFLTLTLTFISIFLIGKKEKFAWVYGVAYGLIIAGIGFLFPEKNYNCIIRSCVDLIPNFPLYSVTYIFGYILIVMIPFTWIMNKFLKK